ncbi:hypothetical protein GIB67_003795 [Kingdonia uniflora]|uniref:Uncharacterized protein n=1 Tax=Kingdonia uniflora TaxID=39325 RepID=A0A7J7L716_9MAGN|nr:hypothetical protein GIB67_003795 [Kingdonia uniflora]
MEGKQKATKEKQNKKDEMIRNVNAYGNDDEVEEVGIQILKKRKGPMDAFVAPIDVDFRPRAPTSNENKKALENIHGYIADFFYENNISFNCARLDSYSKMMQAIVQYNDPSTLSSLDEIESNTKLKESLLDCIAKLALDEENGSQILRDLIVYRTKTRRLGKMGAQACVKTIAPVEWWITFGSEIHTKKMNCLEHDRMRDLAYTQYNKRLKKRYEELISGKEIDPIVLKSLDECAEWLVPDDVRDDILLGTDITYGVLEDAEDGLDDPLLTRTSRTNTALHCSQGGASSSRSTARHLQDSSDDDDYDVDANYDVGDGDDDGIDSGSDDDI